MQSGALLFVSLLATGCSAATPTPALDGSYDVTVTAKIPNRNLGDAPPSNGIHARLDVRQGGGGYECVVTPDFGEPGVGTCVLASGAFHITLGGVHVAAKASIEDDQWRSMTLPVSGGAFAGTASLDVREFSWSADSQTYVDFEATGTVVVDVRPPTVQLAGRPTADGKYLPWDSIGVVVEEPVDPTSFASAAKAKIGTTTVVLAPASASWAGSTTFVGSMPVTAAGAGLITIGALTDRNGTSGFATTFPFEVLDIGTPAAVFDFDGNDSSQVGTWANPVVDSGSACETGGCIRLGPTGNAGCRAPPNPGIAGRLTSGATMLTLRARGATDTVYPPGSLGYPSGGLEVDVVDTAGVKKTQSVNLAKLVAGWMTISIPIADAVAFAVHEAISPECGPYPIPSTTTVWVDAIHAQ